MSGLYRPREEKRTMSDLFQPCPCDIVKPCDDCLQGLECQVCEGESYVKVEPEAIAEVDDVGFYVEGFDDLPYGRYAIVRLDDE